MNITLCHYPSSLSGRTSSRAPPKPAGETARAMSRQTRNPHRPHRLFWRAPGSPSGQSNERVTSYGSKGHGHRRPPAGGSTEEDGSRDARRDEAVVLDDGVLRFRRFGRCDPDRRGTGRQLRRTPRMDSGRRADDRLHGQPRAGEVRQRKPRPRLAEEPTMSKDETTGRIKEAAGDLNGDKGLQREGETEQAEGKVKDAVDSAADETKDVVNRD